MKLQFILAIQDKITKPMAKLSFRFTSLEKKSKTVNTAVNDIKGSLKGLKFPIQLNGGLSAMDRNLRRINRLIVGGFIGRTIAGWGASIVTSAVEAERAQVRLNNVFGADAPASAYLQQIKKLAISAKLPLGETTEALTQMAQRGQVLNATELNALGDFAAFTKSPIGELSEALEDVTSVEKWQAMGVQVQDLGDRMQATFRGNTIEIDKTKQGALDMVKAFGSLQDVQGAASKQNGSIGASITALKNKFALLSQDLAQKLRPTILAVVGTLSSMADRLSSVIDWIQANQQTIISWGGTILTVSGYLLGLYGAFRVFNVGRTLVLAFRNATILSRLATLLQASAFIAIKAAILGFNLVLGVARLSFMAFNLVILSNPIGLFIAGIATLITGLIGLGKLFPALGEKLQGFYNAVKDWFGRAWTWVKENFINPIFDKLKAIGEFFGLVQSEAEQQKVDPIDKTSIDALNSARDNLKDLGGSFDFKAIVKDAKPANQQANQPLKTPSKTVSSSLAPKRSNTIINIKSLVEQLIVHTATPKERPAAVQNELTKVLTQAVNNLNHAT